VFVCVRVRVERASPRQGVSTAGLCFLFMRRAWRAYFIVFGIALYAAEAAALLLLVFLLRLLVPPLDVIRLPRCSGTSCICKQTLKAIFHRNYRLEG
jgi:hypothetical protein